MFEHLAGRRAGFIKEANISDYAVIVPYLPKEEALLFEVRAQNLRRQPGEISLPGGKIEKGETPIKAALRETCEELLAQKSDMQIIAPLDKLLHMGGSVIHPFLAQINNYGGSYNTSEVAEVFTVPVGFFLSTKPDVYVNEISVIKEDESFPHQLLGGERYPSANSKRRIPAYVRYALNSGSETSFAFSPKAKTPDEDTPGSFAGGNARCACTFKYPWAVAPHRVVFYNYKGRVIWGITARIIENLVEVYKNTSLRF